MSGAASKARLLLVEDDRDLGRGLAFNLEREGYDVRLAADAAAARRALKETGPERPDLVVLDLTLPDGDGLDLLRELRRDGAATPVICLTARSQESDVVTGLRLGADDYVTKPFGLAQLFARIEAVLRRARPGATGGSDVASTTGETVELGTIRVDLASHRVERGDEPTEELTPIEAQLLRYLLDRRGRALDRAQILKDMWGLESRHATRTLDNHVARLRKKIERDPANPRFLVTVHGIGYRFERGSS